MEEVKGAFLRIEKVTNEVPVYDLSGKVVKTLKLPKVFTWPVREDLIRKVFLALRTSRLQPQGRDPLAGKRTTAESWGVGHGVARVPRVKGGDRAARIPQARGGRRAHPPVVWKKIIENVNRKEKRVALLSAIAATAVRYFVERRGHRIDRRLTLPIVVVDEVRELKKASEVKEFLKNVNLWDDLMRAREGVKIRAGKGKMRGRRCKKPKSVLIVVDKDEGIGLAARNLIGVDVRPAFKLSVLDLAPGGVPGRLTVWTESALKYLSSLKVSSLET